MQASWPVKAARSSNKWGEGGKKNIKTNQNIQTNAAFTWRLSHVHWGQGGKTQKCSSSPSLQSGRWSHTNVYGTRSAPLLHSNIGGSGVRGASQDTWVSAQQSLLMSHDKNLCVT